jgi:hypothetical protein
MSGYVVSPSMIESEIVRLGELLENTTHEFGKMVEEADMAEAHYRIAFAKAFVRYRLGEKSSEKTAEQQATIECEDLLLARKAAEGRARHLEESCRSLREQLGAARSLGANIRAQT